MMAKVQLARRHAKGGSQLNPSLPFAPSVCLIYALILTGIPLKIYVCIYPELSLTLDGADASERNGLHITVEERWKKPSSWTGWDEAINCSFKLAARTSAACKRYGRRNMRRAGDELGTSWECGRDEGRESWGREGKGVQFQPKTSKLLLTHPAA